jgi:hypothetical protein
MQEATHIGYEGVEAERILLCSIFLKLHRLPISAGLCGCTVVHSRKALVWLEATALILIAYSSNTAAHGQLCPVLVVDVHYGDTNSERRSSDHKPEC